MESNLLPKLLFKSGNKSGKYAEAKTFTCKSPHFKYAIDFSVANIDRKVFASFINSMKNNIRMVMDIGDNIIEDSKMSFAYYNKHGNRDDEITCDLYYSIIMENGKTKFDLSSYGDKGFVISCFSLKNEYCIQAFEECYAFYFGNKNDIDTISPNN